MTKYKSDILLQIFIVLCSLAIYSWSNYRLGQNFDFGFIILLAIPCLLYIWYYKNKPETENLKSGKTAILLIVYGVLYFIGIFFLPLLGSSVTYWLVQFLIPILILKFSTETVSSIDFRWSAIFADFKSVIISSIILVPVLMFTVRDSEQILAIAKTWKFLVYFPLSIIFMIFVAAFWEEFFFRGIIMKSLLKFSENPALSIFLSALLFGSYHIPMRYLNAKSPYYNDLISSIAATLNEQFLMGLLMGIIVYKSKNVWHGIWLHAVLNGISFVYKLSEMVKI